MTQEIDIEKYHQLALQKQKEHRKVLTNLKKKPPKNLDKIAQEIHDEVFQEIDCTACANCCKTLGPDFKEADITRIAKYFKMKLPAFEAEFLQVDEDGDKVFIDPTSLIDFALQLYSEQGIEFDAAEVAQQVRDFFHGRLVSMARDEKIPADTVAAVSAVHIIAPSVFFARCAALDEARKNDAETFDNLATAYARAAHISKPELGAEYDRSLMGEVELALADASEAAQTAVDAALAAEDYPAAFAALAALRAPIDRFFDEVMVMDKDEQLRDNRLKLLNRFEAVFSGIANIGELARKK